MLMHTLWLSALALGTSGDSSVLTQEQFNEMRSQVEPFRGKVDGPDVMGGHASSHVIVRLGPDVTPMQLGDGRWTLTKANAERDGAAVAAQLAATLADFAVKSISRTLPFEPANAALAEAFGLLRYYTVRVPLGSNTPALATALAAFPSYIEHAETDGIGGVLEVVPNDPSFNVQYSLKNTGQNIQGQVGIPGADIKATFAWDIHTGSDQIIIAIIDTGVSATHEDLAPNVISGYNAMDGSSNTNDSFLISHGTHCAGIAGARGGNGLGIAGVTWTSKIMPIKVLNLFGGGTETDCANGVIWAADNGASVGSMSLGFPDGIAYFENAINYAHAQGMVLTAATGNTPGAQIFFPARWANTMAVGATDNRDNLASFTTTGPQMTVTAPGVDVYSTYAALFSGPYVYQSGTSMACPHVAGLAALVWSANSSLTNDQVRQIIEQSADDLGAPGWDQQFGHGRINAHQALLAATGGGLENDSCDGAIAVGTGVTTFSTSMATTTGPDEPAMCDFFGDTQVQNDVWFTHVPECSGLLTIDLCASSFAAKLAVYSENCPQGSGEAIACSVAACGTRAKLTLPVTAGETLILRVGGHLGAQGDAVMDITCEAGVPCPADLNGSGAVDVQDLLILLSAWGPCGGGACPADLNDSGAVDVQDLLILLGAWGPCE